MAKKNKLFFSFNVYLFFLVFFIGNTVLGGSAYSIEFDHRTADPYLVFAQQLDGPTAFSYVEKLTSNEFEGRLSGTPGADKAAEWISQVFKMFGLVPGGNKEHTSYFQPFEVPVYEIKNPCSFKMKQPEVFEFAYRKDFVVSPYSGSGIVSGDVVFVGYGIKDSSLSYNDFEGVSLENKIALILRKSPSFANFQETSQYFSTKINLAKEHGAKAIIFADLPNERNPYSMDMKPARGIDSEIPVLFLSSNTVHAFLKHKGHELSELVQTIESKKKSYSFDLNCSAEIQTSLFFGTENTSNVIGYLPSRTNSEESILVVAHYDHLGIDWVDMSYYHGANDNASGAGTLIEVARALTHQCFTSEVNIVFIAFSGEEEGLLGSFHYVQNPLFPLDKIQAVYNMDMVGTGTGELIAGTSKNRYPQLYETLKNSAESLSIQITFSENLLLAGSDHYPFHLKKIPNVFFIRRNPTGIGSYHTPDDTLDTIDPKNLEETGQVIILSMMELIEPLFMVVDSEDWKEKETHKPYLRVYGLGNYAFRVRINEQVANQGKNARFFTVIPLIEGQNLIHVSIYDDTKLVFEKLTHINARIQPELAGDFNNDLVVDIHDLRYFSRFFGQKLSGIEKWAVCDLNWDGIINEEDANLFQKYYGYQGD